MAYFKFSLKQCIATAIGTLMFFLLARFLTYPIPIYGDVFLNLHLNLQYTVVCFFAVIFGPVCGFLIGFFGLFFSYFSFGEGLLWGSIIASASVGFLSGFMFRPGKIDDDEFDGMDAVRFIIGSMITHIISWGIIKPVCDILFNSYHAGTAFIQGFTAAAGNFVLTAIVSTLLILGYSKTLERTIETT